MEYTQNDKNNSIATSSRKKQNETLINYQLGVAVSPCNAPRNHLICSEYTGHGRKGMRMC